MPHLLSEILNHELAQRRAKTESEKTGNGFDVVIRLIPAMLKHNRRCAARICWCCEEPLQSRLAEGVQQRLDASFCGNQDVHAGAVTHDPGQEICTPRG